MNKITIYGRLTQDLELRQTSAGIAWTQLRVASNGRKKEEVNYFDAKAFRGTAEICAKYLKKGDPIVLYGSMSQYEYTNKDGVKVRAWEVLVDDVDFLTSKKSDYEQPKPQENVGVQMQDEAVGELPF